MKNPKQNKKRLQSRRHLAHSHNHSNQRTLVTWATIIANVTTTLITKVINDKEKRDGNVSNHGNHGIKETKATILTR
jgi:hypothetical protein